MMSSSRIAFQIPDTDGRSYPHAHAKCQTPITTQKFRVTSLKTQILLIYKLRVFLLLMHSAYMSNKMVLSFESLAMIMTVDIVAEQMTFLGMFLQMALKIFLKMERLIAKAALFRRCLVVAAVVFELGFGVEVLITAFVIARKRSATACAASATSAAPALVRRCFLLPFASSEWRRRHIWGRVDYGVCSLRPTWDVL